MTVETDPELLPAADVAVCVRLASRVVPATWGLDHVVAVNPLHGFEDLPFEEATDRATDLYGARTHLPIDRLVARALDGRIGPGHLLAAIAEHGLDPGTADVDDAEVIERWIERTRRVQDRDPGSSGTSSTELRRHGVHEVAGVVDVLVAHWLGGNVDVDRLDGSGSGPSFAAWWRRAPHDPDLRSWTSGAVTRIVAAIPEDPSEAVARLLAARGVNRVDAVGYLEAQLARLPGWAAVIARRSDGTLRHELVELAALRLAVEHVLLEGVTDAPWAREHPAGAAEGGTVDGVRRATDEIDAHEDAAVWQSAAELALADRLLTSVGTLSAVVTGSDRPAAQVVCCIDVRSEPLRRHLEAVGPYETFGFAGFFGLPIRVHGVDDDTAVASCPVIVDPRGTVVESVVRGRVPTPERADAVHRGFHAAGHGHGGGFVLADAAGWLLGLRSVATALTPGGWQRLRAATSGRPARRRRTEFRIEPDGSGGGLVPEDRIRFVHGALTAMGLTSRFAPIVVLCAHGSINRNNPFRSSLDCGACGANPGAPNARVLATLANDPDVRLGLAGLGIDVPDDTWFVAAEHETTDEAVRLLDPESVPAHVAPAVRRVFEDLATAADRSRAEREERLPAPPRSSGRSKRSDDPAQVTPDWGLVRCSSIVIGPRSITAGVDLDRRTFLHSYDPEADTDGTVLEAIMTGPVVVAHWISSQYYFSTVDPERFGAGSKPLHNVIGRVGVTEGVGVDLRVGLPLESVWFDGEPVHDPLRLLVVVDAPRDRVDAVVARNPVLQRLFDHGWARLAARDTDHGPGWLLRGRDGSWSTPPTSDVARPAARPARAAIAPTGHADVMASAIPSNGTEVPHG